MKTYWNIHKSLKKVDSLSAYTKAIDNLQEAINDSDSQVTHDDLPVVLMADEFQLIQVFQNLIGNSIKYRSKERPDVHVSAQQKNNKWIFSVRDNGIGIDLKHSDRVFKIFQHCMIGKNLRALV